MYYIYNIIYSKLLNSQPHKYNKHNTSNNTNEYEFKDNDSESPHPPPQYVI